MKIRRYIAKNNQEAILKVKMDLGNDAVILNTRKVRQKGLLKFFSKQLVEVLAAVDDDYGKKKEKVVQEIPKKEENHPKMEKYEKEENKFDEKEEKISELENKVNTMETLLNKINEQVQNTTTKQREKESVEKLKALPNELQVFYNNLIKNEVEPEIAKKIMDKASEKIGENVSINDSASIVYNIISGILGKPETITIKDNGKPTVVMFVGPTGVGKTTTLAKVAANYSLNQRKRVGLITGDTYRIAAVEQLKTYAEILGMPVTVIYSANEIKEAIAEHSDKDIILIDTAGRSHRNKSQFEELKSLVIASEADEIYLVLSTTTSIHTCREIIANYNFLKNFKLIFTKLDETAITGIMLNAKYLTNKSLSYVTTGQSVPDDIEIANVDKISKNLLGSIK